VKTYTSPKTTVKNSKKEGKGFFAVKKIFKDEIVAIKNGHIVAFNEAMALDKQLGDFSLQIADDFFICPKTNEEIDDVVIYINHSCEPNIGMDGQINYIAMRDIEPGEELCLDYAMAMTTNYKLACNCGADSCRGKITGEDWKNKKLQEKYGNYFAWFILKKIRTIIK
jgi:SET domain-containing protein